MRARTSIFAAAAVLAAAGLVLALDLAKQPADPPRDLSVSTGVLDEGIWSHNAVNDASHGHARLDDFNPMVVTAGSWMYRASYAAFGVGLTQTRLPSIVFGALLVMLVGFVAGREDRVAGVIAAWLLATTSLFLSYSRLGLLETPAAAIAMRRDARAFALGGGALLAFAIAVKPQVAAAAAGAAAGLVVGHLIMRRGAAERGPSWRTLGYAVAGFAIAAAAWGTYVGTHLDAAARSEWRWHSSGVLPRISDIPGNISTYLGSSDGFGTRARPLLIAATAGLVVQGAAWAARKRTPGPVDLAGAGWALAGIAVVASLPYTPSRYAVLPLPGLALVAGGGVAAVRALAAGATKRGVVVGAVLSATALAAVPGIRAWSDWASHPTFDLRRTARLLATDTAPGDVVMGGWALLPSVEAHRRVIVFHVPNINDRCPVERFGVDWLMINEGDPADRAFYDERYPGLISPANRVAPASVLGRRLALYRVPPGTVGPGCG
jgi:hypothetical protein